MSFGYTRNAVAFGCGVEKQARRFVVVNSTAAPFADVGIMQYVGYCKPTLQVGQMKRFCFWWASCCWVGDASNNRLMDSGMRDPMSSANALLHR